MSKTIRIRTQPNDGDKYLKIKLDQSFDFLEILSLKLSQEELYRIFAADYGVIVGRVIANRGFGVPNAKVSVFVPLDDNENDPEIIGRYPYNTVNDTDNQGIRYNLLEDKQQGKCHTPVGTFPNKRKLLDNEVWLEIYDKYYKYTTTTNEAGDFMIFGVPTGNQKLHMDVDLSDIGFLSVKPYELINQGYTSNLFQSNTTFKSGTDLDSLVQIQSRDFNVNVLPFWGDSQQNEVGINRVDFNLNTDITPTAIFFGSAFSEQRNKGVYKRCTPRARNGRNCEFSTGIGQVEMIRRVSNESSEVEYINNNTTKIDENGNWSIIVPMNLNTVVTDEFGNLIPSEDPNIGIPTESDVRFRVSLDEFKFGFRKRTGHYLIPNMYNRFDFSSDTPDGDFFTMRWKKAYTVTNYIPRYQKNQNDESRYFTGIKQIGECDTTTSFPYNRIDANVNILYNVLCILIAAAGIIIDFINTLLSAIIFGVVLRFVCLIKHPFNSGKRAACRCSSCLRLNSNIPPASGVFPVYPEDWDGSEDDNGNSIDDRLECATCYDAGDDGQTYSITVLNDLVGSITTNTVDATNGTYNNVEVTSNGSGTEATFDVTVSGNAVTSVICISGGAGYDIGDTITISTTDIGGTTDVVITLTASDLDTTISASGTTIDCEDFDYTLCTNLCQTCDLTIIPLTCNDIDYDSGTEWANCVKEGLAEDLGVIQYEFYNDWIIGSLYNYLFDYKVRFKKNGKEFEKFCDYDCFVTRDLNDEHGKNVCKDAYIIEKEDFNNGVAVKKQIDDPNTSTDGGRGLVVEYNDFLYYAARNDIEINQPNASGLTVEQKENLLFATNIIELGSIVSCDLDGEPFVIDRLEPTTYQTDEGVGTLFNVDNCVQPVQDINQQGIQVISQAGVDVLVAETERISTSPVVISGDDDEEYQLTGLETNLPDYDGNSSILILDRDDIILRRLLCENFDYYAVNGTYSTTDHPTGGDFLEDEDGDTVESTTDTCSGFDDIRDDVTYFSSDNMPPYYMYFGIKLGQTSLEKMKNDYFDNCIE